MAIQELTSSQETKQIHEEPVGNYERLCDLVHVSPIKDKIQIDTYRDVNKMAEVELNERLTAALSVFLDIASADETITEKIDKTGLMRNRSISDKNNKSGEEKGQSHQHIGQQ